MQLDKGSRLLFRCPDCAWYRFVVDGPMAGESYVHPIYGQISYGAAAQTDVLHHDCEEHKQAMRRREQSGGSRLSGFGQHRADMAAKEKDSISEAGVSGWDECEIAKGIRRN